MNQIAWDERPANEWPHAFYETVKASIVDPVSFFGMVANGSGFLRPWFYAIIISMIVFLSAAAYQAGFGALEIGTQIADAVRRAIVPSVLISGPIFILFIVVFGVIVMPIAVTTGLLIQTSLFHLGLLIAGGAKKDFGATFRVICYSAGPQVFQVIPILGGLVAPMWCIVLNFIGLKVVHETSYAKSAFAVFLPLILCCGVILLILATAAGGIFAALVTK